MSEQIEASSRSIIELTKGISECIKKISSLNNDLSTQLKTLGNTFQDEGYAVIQGYVTSSQTKVNEAVPDLKIVMEKLVEYARLLQESEKSIT